MRRGATEINSVNERLVEGKIGGGEGGLGRGEHANAPKEKRVTHLFLRIPVNRKELAMKGGAFAAKAVESHK